MHCLFSVLLNNTAEEAQMHINQLNTSKESVLENISNKLYTLIASTISTYLFEMFNK